MAQKPSEQKSPPTPGGVQKPVFAQKILFIKALRDEGYNDDIIDLAFEKYEVKHNDDIYIIHINY